MFGRSTGDQVAGTQGPRLAGGPQLVFLYWADGSGLHQSGEAYQPYDYFTEGPQRRMQPLANPHLLLDQLLQGGGSAMVGRS
jgi:hypothetical protein